MDSGKGWICLHRAIQDTWLWDEKPFSKGQAFVDLLLLANYKDVKTPYKGEVITCKRGDVNRSILSLANRWGWDRKTVRKYLSILEKDGKVKVYATTHRTTITIVNYGYYQDIGTTKGITKGTTKSQQEGQQSTSKVDINNNDNNENNENKYSANHKTNGFHNFDQREYNYDSLEKKLREQHEKQ